MIRPEYADIIMEKAKTGKMVFGASIIYTENAVDIVGSIMTGKPINMETRWQTNTLAIREKTKIIKSLPEEPRFKIRAGVIKVYKVSLMAVVLKIRRKMYCTSIVYKPRLGDLEKSMLRDLASVDKITVDFYGDKRRDDRSFMVENCCKDTFTAALKKYRPGPLLTREEFDKGYKEIDFLYPTLESIWYSLGNESLN